MTCSTMLLAFSRNDEHSRVLDMAGTLDQGGVLTITLKAVRRFGAIVERHALKRLLWATMVAVAASCVSLEIEAQCYEFLATSSTTGASADLRVNITNLPVPVVNGTPGNGSAYYSDLNGLGNSATLTYNSSTIQSTTPLPELLIRTVSSGVDNFSSFYLYVNLGSVIATIQLRDVTRDLLPNGLPAVLPASWNGTDSMSLTYDSALEISAIRSCTPKVIPKAVSLSPATLLPSGASASGISPIAATADFNGDGVPDLALTNISDASVSVLLGNGSGGFAAPVKYAVGKSPYGIMAGDFNGDGKPDLAVVNGLDNTVSILLNNGSGGFPAKPTYTYAVGNAPFGVSLADLNLDGSLDLVVTNQGSNTISILYGKSDGSFQTAVSYATGNSPFGTAIADVNGDSYLDLVTWNLSDNTVSVLLNSHTGKFYDSQGQYATAYATGSDPFSVAVGDFNGDGFPDVAVANLGSNTVSVLLNNYSSYTFYPAVTYPTGLLPTSVVAADLNGDGILDLAVANLGDNTVMVLLGANDGTFVPQATSVAEVQPYGLLAADFNGDGKLDLAVTSFYQNSFGVLLQRAGTAASKVTAAPKGTLTLSK